MNRSSHYYHAIFLSPHLDDAALSCGGQIALRTAAGQRVLVVTFMAGDAAKTAVSEFADAMHRRWELDEHVVADRRAEDVAACQIMGAAHQHESLLDAIYRHHPESGDPYYQSNNALFGAVDAADAAETLPRLTAIMAGLPARGRIFAPLAVGNHVDHQLVRRAAEDTFGAALWYYEDYPYVRITGALEMVVPSDKTGWYAERVPLNETALQTKIEAIAAYASQLSSFFNGRSDLENQIRQQADISRGERIWQRGANV